MVFLMCWNYDDYETGLKGKKRMTMIILYVYAQSWMFIWSFKVRTLWVCFQLLRATWVSSKRHTSLVMMMMMMMTIYMHIMKMILMAISRVSLRRDFPWLWWYNMDDGIMDIKWTCSSESALNRSFQLHTWTPPRHRLHIQPTYSLCQNMMFNT